MISCLHDHFLDDQLLSTPHLYFLYLVATVFGLINLPCVSSWMIMGQQIRRLLHNQVRLRLFNWTMAVMLVLSLAPVLSL